MRLHFDLTPNTQTVPFDYQHHLVGAFHKWMGLNDIHNTISLYSLGWLKGGEMVKNGLEFKNGSRIFISFWDEEIGKQLIFNATRNPEVFNGMFVSDITIQENPIFSSRENFNVSSPILIRKYDENRKATHLTYEMEESDHYLTETLLRKLKSAGLSCQANVRFLRNHPNAKTKLVRIKEINNRASMCPVIIEGDTEAIQFAWNVGVGHSTGSGFGALY